MRRIVLTGGPGGGKTALLHALGARGHAIVAESARAIIQARKARSLSPRPNPLEFAQEVLTQDIEQYERQETPSATVFFDRGILDALCMLNRAAPLAPTEFKAFLTFEGALRVYEELVQWYRRGEYEVVEVPRLSVAERCAYVLHAMDAAA